MARQGFLVKKLTENQPGECVLKVMGDFSESSMTRYCFCNQLYVLCDIVIWTEGSSIMYNSEVSASVRKYKLDEMKLHKESWSYLLRT